MKDKNNKQSLIVERLRSELEHHQRKFADIAEKSDVTVHWLHSIMKKSNTDVDPGVRRCERVLETLGIKVELND